MSEEGWFTLIIIAVVILIVIAIGYDIFLTFHCWGLPLDTNLPYECFNNGFYSVINN